MKIAIDPQNYIKVVPEIGGRITELVLLGHTIIKAKEPYNDNSSGNFLMFPWISKAPENPYDPSLKNHYHGFSINTPREVEIERVAHDELKIIMKERIQHQDRHNFVEVLTIRKGSLSILLKVIENQKDKNPYCFGYHPYIQIDQEPIDSLTIQTDIQTLLEFDQHILPIYPFKERQISINSQGSYNNLFKGGKFFSLKSKEVIASVESDLPYWQIYNPPERNTIAVEPVSFCGNLYNIYHQDNNIHLAKQGNIAIKVRTNDSVQ